MSVPRPLWLGAALALHAAPGVLLAQAEPARPQEVRAGPWVPIGSRLDRLVEWIVAEGGLERVDPLTRPYRLASVRRAALSQDTMQLSPAGRRSFAWLQRELAAAEDSTAVVAEAGEAAYRNARRDEFRGGGRTGAGAMAGVWVSMTRGPFVAVVNPGFENRLKDDPEFTGDTARVIAGRMQTGYLSASGEVGDLFYGRASRNWGPDLFDGLQLSPSAYATDMLTGTLRVGRFELTTIAQRLDDDTTGGVRKNRYFLAHRLGIRAGRRVWVALTETGVYGGPGHGFEPALHSPLTPAFLAEVNERKDVNLQWGLELHAPLSRALSFEGELMVDDFQIESDTLFGGYRRPWSGGFTLQVRGAVPSVPVHVTLGYTRVRSLTYRNSHGSYEMYAIEGVGIARNYSDYDQLLLRLEAWPAERVLLGLDASYLRQGSGDFRQPFPSDTVLATSGQGFLVAPIARTAGLRAWAKLEPTAGLLISGALGTSGKLGGGSAPIATVSVRVRFDLLRRALRAPYPGVEEAATP